MRESKYVSALEESLIALNVAIAKDWFTHASTDVSSGESGVMSPGMKAEPDDIPEIFIFDIIPRSTMHTFGGVGGPSNPVHATALQAMMFYINILYYSSKTARSDIAQTGSTQASTEFPFEIGAENGYLRMPAAMNKGSKDCLRIPQLNTHSKAGLDTVYCLSPAGLAPDPDGGPSDGPLKP
ncbi:hypothetical protein DdX_16018 [Ditylenchus destructor]|uniref:Uncharacterized protein n=1 Tax=Ditylenchus destructor TaxID=166010 RepID=A0AAD4QX45_9BILA|nr:hypothetical protein DdX_16018 [Ditylenchus destructor]